ncbi:hypothetical protein HYS95_00100 [Candidatus Daviesbacteria bacterium]|nr:hypothetical protein [Candidatus Daviesbacteria bacterium]
MNMTQQRLKIDDYYSTSDLALASAIALYYPLEAVDRTQDPYKAQFLFKKESQLDQLIESYWRGELRIEPQAYFNQLKAIKARLYADRRQP